MSTYRLNSTVSSQEADALKEMIFKRARERAQSLNEDVQNTYTTAVQNDIMDLARDSFVSTKNPFSQQQEEVNPTQQADVVESKTPEIGFAQRQIKEFKTQIQNKNNIVNHDIANKEVESAMNDARAELGRKQSFMGALDFLNSQATIALVKNKGKVFEALA